MHSFAAKYCRLCKSAAPRAFETAIKVAILCTTKRFMGLKVDAWRIERESVLKCEALFPWFASALFNDASHLHL